jgi:hypothetical protein
VRLAVRRRERALEHLQHKVEHRLDKNDHEHYLLAESLHMHVHDYVTAEIAHMSLKEQEAWLAREVGARLIQKWFRGRNARRALVQETDESDQADEGMQGKASHGRVCHSVPSSI